MPAPTSPTRIAAYRALRRLGHPRTRAADVAGISIRTAQRIDDRQRSACAWCGAQLPRHRKDPHDV